MTDSVPILESDTNLSSLDKLEQFFKQTAYQSPKEPNQQQVQVAYQIGGPTLAQAIELYWTWIDEFASDHFVQINEFSTDWEKKHKQHNKQFQPQKGVDVITFTIDAGHFWTVMVDPECKQPTIAHYHYQFCEYFGSITRLADDRLIHTTESLEQLLVSALLDMWSFRVDTDKEWQVILPKHVLSQDWELLWQRPSFMAHQSLFYSHKSLNLLLGGSTGYSMLTGKAEDIERYQHLCEQQPNWKHEIAFETQIFSENAFDERDLYDPQTFEIQKELMGLDDIPF